VSSLLNAAIVSSIELNSCAMSAEGILSEWILWLYEDEEVEWDEEKCPAYR
jgi:hypothetical protein